MAHLTSPLLSLAILSSVFAAALPVCTEAAVSLPDSYIQQRGSRVCGFVDSRWSAGFLQGDLFTTYRSRIAELEGQLRNVHGAQRRSLKKRIASLKRQRTVTHQSFCRRLDQPVNPYALTNLPPLSELVESANAQNESMAVSGTPPAIPAITSAEVPDLFWRSGVVAAVAGGSADENQCAEFWFGATDGVSGGMGACNMTQGVAYSLESILNAGVSLCYMQNAPTQANMDAGGVSLVSGRLPENDVTRLFAPPLGSAARLVKVLTTPPMGQTIFIRVRGEGANRAAEERYRAELWFCYTQSPTADAKQQISVSSDGEYRIDGADTEGESSGGYVYAVSAVLRAAGGTLEFDSAQDRTASVTYVEPSGAMSFKSDIRVTPDDRIYNKSYRVFPGTYRLEYIVSGFSGSTLQTLRFLEGGFKAEDHFDGQPVFYSLGGTEYRDNFYAAAPSGQLVDEAAGMDFTGDEYYSEPPAVTIDTSAYSCTADADVVVLMDGSNPAIQAVIAQCQSNLLHDMNFCDANETVQQAKTNWGPTCLPQ